MKFESQFINKVAGKPNNPICKGHYLGNLYKYYL